ncbi:radical SAM protein [Candidatus Shapirobacteria bacterium]|nr:radical SAM protein [Candidatus Shapirobacteria bacterium]
MEKIRDITKKVDVLSKGYTPYWGIPSEELKDLKWEVVCFLHSYCDGTCAHCWSSQTFLGRIMPIEWYKTFWQHVDPARVKEIKLTGGEPFLYRDIGKVVEVIRSWLGPEIPIRIFTGGKSIVSLKSGKKGIEETVQKILQTGVIFENVEIHLSADEHHAGSLYRASKGIRLRPTLQEDILYMNQFGIPFLQTQVKNFLAACEVLVANNKDFGGGKIKVHAETGRLNYHRQEIFSWLSDADWENKVISSEGLIKSGSAKNIESATELSPNSQLSLFLLPGAEFYRKPQTIKAQEYQNPENQNTVYLDVARVGGRGASIIGWWNIVNRIFCGGSAYDAYQLISKVSQSADF